MDPRDTVPESHQEISVRRSARLDGESYSRRVTTVGYARVSTRDQNPTLRHDALAAAGSLSSYQNATGRCQRTRSQPTENSMVDKPDVIVCVDATDDGDQEETAVLARRLCAELLDVDVELVEPLTQETAPEGAKGLRLWPAFWACSWAGPHWQQWWPRSATG